MQRILFLLKAYNSNQTLPKAYTDAITSQNDSLQAKVKIKDSVTQ